MDKEVKERFEMVQRQIEQIMESLEKLTVIAEKLYDSIRRIQQQR